MTAEAHLDKSRDAKSATVSRSERIVDVALTTLLAWGTFAFGGVYRWAWIPLLIGASLIGFAGFIVGRRASGGVPAVTAFWAVSAGAIGLQLVPLDGLVVNSLSPASVAILRERTIGFDATAARTISIEPSLTTNTLLFAGAFGLLFAGVDRLLTSELVERLAKRVLAIGFILAMAGIVQRAYPDSPLYGFWEPIGGTSNAFGPFVNRNHFAGWMVLAIGLGLGYCHLLISKSPSNQTLRARVTWLGSRDGAEIILTAFALLIMMLATVWSLSRSGTIGLVVVVFASILFQGNWHASTKASSIIAMVALLSALLWRGLGALTEKFANSANLLGRFAAWNDTWTIIADFVLTGTGLNTYTVATLFYQRSNKEFHLAEAHNDYLQLLSDGGLLVTIPAMLTVVAIIRAIRLDKVLQPIRPAGVRIAAIQRGAVYGLLGISVQELAEFSLQKPSCAFLSVLLLAVAIYEPGRPRRIVLSSAIPERSSQQCGMG